MFPNTSWSNESSDVMRGAVVTSPMEAVLITGSTPVMPLTEDDVGSTSNPQRTIVNVILETVTLSILWVAALVGNSLVCLVIYRSRRLQSTTNYFVVSLACADLVYAIFVMPFLLANLLAGRWIGGVVLCKFVRYTQWVVPISMVTVLISICVDRFYTIIYPLSFKVTRGDAKRMILLSWLVAVVLASPGLYLYGLQEDSAQGTGGGLHCRMYLQNNWDGLFVLFLAIGMYFLPMFGIVIGYSRIFRFIWQSGVGGRTFQRTVNSVPRSKVKMVKLIIVVNLVIFVLMTPWLMCQLYYCMRSANGPINSTVYIAVVWVFFSNTVTKPAIYLCYNSNFRRGCKEVLCMSSMKCYRSNAYTITATSHFGKRNHIGVVEPSLYGSEIRRIESPTKTFDRTTMVDKIAWPISSQAPSTYL